MWEFYYSTGEFARLNGVNKRTLHYYDQIGLFSPEHKGENGYRYCTCMQFEQLELILLLRRIGFSIQEIKTYTQSPSGGALEQLIRDKQADIDRSIRELLEAKEFLNRKADKLALERSIQPGQVQLVTLPAQGLLLSAPIRGDYQDLDFAVASEFSQRLRERCGLYDNFGSRISVQNLRQGRGEEYDCFFARVDPQTGPVDELRPGGSYLQIFARGSWEQLGRAYQALFAEADRRGLELTGYAYEEGINEISLHSPEEYLTRIQIPCRPKRSE